MNAALRMWAQEAQDAQRRLRAAKMVDGPQPVNCGVTGGATRRRLSVVANLDSFTTAEYRAATGSTKETARSDLARAVRSGEVTIVCDRLPKRYRVAR